MTGRALIAAALMLLPMPCLAADDIVFDIAPVAACMAREAGRDCIGQAAGQCMEATPMGGTTYGMGACLEQERAWWDARLNSSYQAALVKARASDAEMTAAGATAAARAEALRAMQRAWIPYRDARCAYERSLWMGGTGSGPATLSCLLQVTAEQVLVLEGGMDY